jgi:hypothetical protein
MSGWCEEYHVQWVVTDIGIVLFGGGMILIFQGIQTYIIDAFTLHSASGEFGFNIIIIQGRRFADIGRTFP